jgi:hypothetical protein
VKQAPNLALHIALTLPVKCQTWRPRCKDHALLSLYDGRLGCPADADANTRYGHETTLLRDYDTL